MSAIPFPSMQFDQDYAGKVFVPESIDGKIKSAWQQRIDQQRRVQGDAAYVIAPDEITKLQNQINEVLYFEAVSMNSVSPVAIGQGLTNFEYWYNNTPQAPRQTENFSGGENKQVNKTYSTVKLVGMDYDIDIPKTIIDAGNLGAAKKINLTPTVQNNITGELMRALMQYRERWIWLGSAGQDFTDTGIKGIVNWSGINTTSTDSDWTTVGDVFLNIMRQAGKLIQSKFRPPFTVYLTPKVYNQAIVNINTTSSKTDMQLLMEATDANGQKMFDGVYANPFLINAAETTSTGAAATIKRIPENFVAESYAPGIYPLISTDLGWKAKLLWMGGTVLERPTAVCFQGSLTTNT